MLSDTEIQAELGRDVIIHPFVWSQLKPNSYDIGLGEYFYVEQYRGPEEAPVDYDIYDEDSIKETWALVKVPVCLDGKFKGRRVLWLRPGERVLGHSVEFIGGRGRVTSMIKTRSSLGRSGISTCLCAGSGDIGFINRYTLEITNHLRYHSVPLVVGEMVAQILFFRTGECANPYIGKYQASDSLDELVVGWKPEMMLPRLYADAQKWVTDTDFTAEAAPVTTTSTEVKSAEALATSSIADTVVLCRPKDPEVYVIECLKCESLLCIDVRKVQSVYPSTTVPSGSLWVTSTGSYVFYCPVCKIEVTQTMRRFAQNQDYTEFRCKRSLAILTNLATARR